MESRVVIIAGIYRSGSTWLYNAVRLLLKDAGFSVYNSFGDNYDDSKDGDYHLVKIHKYDKDLMLKGDYILTSYRSLKGIVGSMKRMKLINQDPRFINGTRANNINRYILDLLKWNMNSDYMMLYGELINHPARVLKNIVETLRIKEPDEYNRIIKELNNLKIPDQGFDPITFYHKGHRTSKP